MLLQRLENLKTNLKQTWDCTTQCLAISSNRMTIRIKNKAAIALTFDSHHQAIAAFFLILYYFPIWGDCLHVWMQDITSHAIPLNQKYSHAFFKIHKFHAALQSLTLSSPGLFKPHVKTTHQYKQSTHKVNQTNTKQITKCKLLNLNIFKIKTENIL